MLLLSFSILLYKRKAVFKHEKSNAGNLHPFVDSNKGYTQYPEWQMENTNHVFVNV